MINKSNLNEEELQQNYSEFIEFLKKTFSGERLEKLLLMYSPDELGNELSIAPASLCEYWHNCFIGGYLLHTMNVVKLSEAQEKLFKLAGCNIDFTPEERIFSALHHDLGKLGSPNIGSYYVLQNEDWKAKKGELYKLNPDIQYMDVTDRTFFNLQYYQIKITWKEWISIKLADGLFSDNNEKYLKTFVPDRFLRTLLPRVIHAADLMAVQKEKNEYNTNLN